MKQKICVISFDHWNYDKHIVTALNEYGVDSFHIKIGNFKYKNTWERIQNTFSKVFLGKNPKLKKRQDYILEMLKEKGHQNQILVINPELIDKEYHLEIKKSTDKYIAYLYDSVSRCPVKHLLDGIFDEIFSFDKIDISTYGFSPITNYIYFDKPAIINKPKQNFIYIGSIDNRLTYLNDFGEHLKKQKQSFKFYAIGKKAFVNQLKQLFLGKNKNIIFKKNRFNQNETLQMYNESETIVDLVRDNQSGLSFRIFEAIGLQKNVITNNKSIETYDIFEAHKIKVISDTSKNIVFSDAVYPENIIKKYHIRNWIVTVFNLNYDK
ncbi:hypothetical protein G6N05_01415 [Flavobacterium sp. F372]|uniref:Glycosyltransferase n=1 Tax=Flavobacterium bernardetii TaxID=2813823 RepID=A0ABR7IV96_9FLAO|nr:hypothetical protein [Flavobacterium bernardetii]MBC5833532.1 hypothetical protein [Flavobacterium bernardetii]NHF68764.1 hypothetical protein [Flavobacterium bernardetii]